LVSDANVKIESGELKEEWNNISNRCVTVMPVARQSSEVMLTFLPSGGGLKR